MDVVLSIRGGEISCRPWAPSFQFLFRLPVTGAGRPLMLNLIFRTRSRKEPDQQRIAWREGACVVNDFYHFSRDALNLSLQTFYSCSTLWSLLFRHFSRSNQLFSISTSFPLVVRRWVLAFLTLRVGQSRTALLGLSVVLRASMTSNSTMPRALPHIGRDSRTYVVWASQVYMMIYVDCVKRLWSSNSQFCNASTRSNNSHNHLEFLKVLTTDLSNQFTLECEFKCSVFSFQAIELPRGIFKILWTVIDI